MHKEKKIKSILEQINLSNGISLYNLCKKLYIDENVLKLIFEASPENVQEVSEIAKKLESSIVKNMNDEIKKVSIVISSEKILSNEHSAKNHKIKHHPPYIKKIILIASGKGGVGKSTIASYLSVCLAENKKIALLDLDFNGPSMPYLFNLENESAKIEENRIIPLNNYNIKLLSMGFLVEQSKAIVWRGPMHSKAIHQFLLTTKWACQDDPIDILIIDMPPGTGDAHITMMENYHVDGVIFVTNTHPLALKDLAKAIDLYKKFDVKNIGCFVNMCNENVISQNNVENFLNSHNLRSLGKIGFNDKFTDVISDESIELFKSSAKEIINELIKQ